MIVERPPANFKFATSAFAELKQNDLDYTVAMSNPLFAYGDKLFGGIARESLVYTPEVWVALGLAFRPFDVRGLRPWIEIMKEHYGYVRARVREHNVVGARFAFACGFMYEEDKGGFHFFSVRA